MYKKTPLPPPDLPRAQCEHWHLLTQTPSLGQAQNTAGEWVPLNTPLWRKAYTNCTVRLTYCPLYHKSQQPWCILGYRRTSFKSRWFSLLKWVCTMPGNNQDKKFVAILYLPG